MKQSIYETKNAIIAFFETLKMRSDARASLGSHIRAGFQRIVGGAMPPAISFSRSVAWVRQVLLQLTVYAALISVLCFGTVRTGQYLFSMLHDEMTTMGQKVSQSASRDPLDLASFRANQQ